jgi:NitT/TauT family transport system substrate-binding protein
MESSATLREVIERAKRGEEAAVVVIVGRFREHALELARALLRDGHLAEDAVQQAFVRAIARLPSLREAGAFPGWLRQIVRTECDHIGRGRSRQSGNDCDDALADRGQSPLDRAISQEMIDAVRRAVRALPTICRDTAELYYLDGQSCGDVARVLRVPEGTVKRRLYDARELLRQELRGLLSEI